MAGYKTAFGNWVSSLCMRYGMSVARLSEELGISAATMSLVISGQQSIPPFLRENIISTFHLDSVDVKELDAVIQEAKTEAVIVDKDFEQYVMVQTPNHAKWAKEMMELMAKKVNHMTEEECAKIRKSLMSVSEKTEEEPATTFKRMPEDILEAQIYKRYPKRPDVAQRIIDYINANKG